MMKRCMQCGKYNIKNLDHDYCISCFKKLEKRDNHKKTEEHFEDDLKTHNIHSVYVMFYGDNDKIGYTNDLSSRMIEIKRKYPKNELVYFREFTTETDARKFEAWLKTLSERELNKFVSSFQDKIKKIKFLI